MRGSKLDKPTLEKKVFDCIQNYIRKNGFAPAIRDICKECDIKSTATVYYIINDLCDKGVLRKPGKNMRRAVGFVSPSIVAHALGTYDPGNGIFSVDNQEDHFSLPSNFFSGDELYIFTQSDDGLKDLGILKGDSIVIQRANEDQVQDGDLVEANIGGRATCRKLAINGDRYTLLSANAENKVYDNIEIAKSAVIGLVVGMMRKY